MKIDDAEIKRLYIWARRIVVAKVPRSEVDDIVEDTVIAIWAGVDKIQNKQFYNTWKYRILLNKIADYYRKQHQQSRVLETAKQKWLRLSHRARKQTPTITLSEFGNTNRDEFAGCTQAVCYQDHFKLEFMDMIRTLRPGWRRVLTLYWYYSLTYDEMVDEMPGDDTNYEQVRSMVRRATKGLERRYVRSA